MNTGMSLYTVFFPANYYLDLSLENFFLEIEKH